MKAPQIIALLTLAGFFLLSLIVANVYQPTMSMDVHCSVHDHIKQAFGGECDPTGLGLFTSIGAFLNTIVVALVIAVALFGINQTFFLLQPGIGRQSWRQLIRPQISLFNFIFSGRAVFRKFI